MKEENDPVEICSLSPKLDNIYTTIIRKNLYTPEKSKLTPEGEEILEFLGKAEETAKIVKKKINKDIFEAWWKAFPGTDTFEYKGKKFVGTRALKAKKDDCKVKLNKILDEGEYTIDELIKALELEISQKKENSYKTGANSLKYMHNSLTYLNQRDFEPFIELIKAGHKIVEETKPITGGVEI